MDTNHLLSRMVVGKNSAWLPGIASFIFLSSFFPEKGLGQIKSQMPSLHDMILVDRFNDLSAHNISISKKDSAEYYADRALEEAQKIEYAHGIALAFSRKSQIAKHFDDDYTLSELFSKNALAYFEKTNDKNGIDTVFYYLFYAAFSQCRFEDAMDYSEKYYSAAVLENNQDEIFNSLSGMFALNRQMGNYEKSFTYAQQLYDIAIKSNNKYWITSSLWDLAELYKLIEDYPTALLYFRKVRDLSDRDVIQDRIRADREIWFDMEFTEVFSLMHAFDSAWHYYQIFKPSNDAYKPVYQVSTGESYLLQGKYEQAMQNFNSGLTGHIKKKDVYEVMRTMLDLANVNMVLGNSRTALEYGREGLDIALQTHVNQFIRDGYQILAEAFDRLHQTDSSNNYFRKYTIVKDVVLNDKTKGKFAAYKYDLRIALMDNEKQIQQIRLQKETWIKNILIVSIFFLVLLAVIFFRNLTLKRRYDARQRELAENNLRIQKLEAERSRTELLQQQSELEMKALRAQMNPHFIFNCLNSINRFIINHEAERAADYLTKFARLIRIVLEMSGKPHIPLTEELHCLKLYMDLEKLRFEKPFAYEIHCHDIDKASILIPSLLIQPFVENAIWHGLHADKNNDGKITIHLNLENDILHCTITDNGVGRRLSLNVEGNGRGIRKSLGIALTEHRLQLADPTHREASGIFFEDLTDEYGKNAGTSVHIKIPVHTE
jgi:tetratricopeptide (TPR) repeat protein